MTNSFISGYKAFLQVERNFATNTIDAYLHDVSLFMEFMAKEHEGLSFKEVELKHLQTFMQSIAKLDFAETSQSRVMSGVKSFFEYLMIEGIITNNPTELLESPKRKQKLPVYLSIEEIEQILAQIDMSTLEGLRSRAIVETLYGCGLRVSELISIQVSNLFLDVGFIRIFGKGSKERLVPVSGEAIKHIGIYLEHRRPHIPIKKGHEDFLFLNNRGTKLSRVTINNTVKLLSLKAGIKKNVHPHVFRHSFATHLVQAGADLRAVQDMLGHSSITTTEIYSHLDNTFLRTTLEKYHPRYKEQ
jgi:integrase/recombinase XerD